MAINLGLANEYNVFVFGDMRMSNTDAEAGSLLAATQP